MIRKALAGIAVAFVGQPTLAQDFGSPRAFITDMSEFGWARGDADSTFWSWAFYTDPDGQNLPNDPNGPGFPVPIPAEFSIPFVTDASAFSRITSPGNIYNLSSPVDITVEFPNSNLGPGFETEIIIQVLTLGNELDPGQITINDIAPIETRELDREFLGPPGQFGGERVETLFRWVLEGNDATYAARFVAAAESTSWGDATVDTFVRESVADPCADLDIDGSGVVNISDLFAFIALFTSQENAGADFDGDGVVNISDLFAYITAFTSCP